MPDPVVRHQEPPAAVVRVFNPVLRRLLRSPLHRLVDGRFMLLTMTGRRTGRTITVPVGRHPAPDGTLLLCAAGRWRHNLRGGADVRLVLEGRERTARAETIADADEAAAQFEAMVARAGPRALALRTDLDRPPTAAELRPLLAELDIARLTLTA